MNDGNGKPTGRLGRLSLLLALGGALALTGRSAVAQTQEPFDIYAILSTSGNAAFFGQAEARSLAVLEKGVNASGGVRGRPVHFVVLDDQTNTQVTVQLVNELIAKHVAVFLGPGIPQACFAALPLTGKSGPVGLCLNPSGRPEPGSYQFDPFPDSLEVASSFLEYFQEHGLTKVALLNSSDASGQDANQAFNAMLRSPQFSKLTKVAEETYLPSDVSVAAQIAKIKAAGAQAIVSFNTGLPFGTVLRGMHDAAFDVPVATTGGNMTYPQMQQYGAFLPKQILFGGLICWAPGDIGPGPIRTAQLRYAQLIRASGGRPDAGSATIWDPGLLTIEAYRKLGFDADAAQMRSYFEDLQGWVGIDGVYNFRTYPQRGVGRPSMLLLSWDKEKQTFVPASGPGGAMRK